MAESRPMPPKKTLASQADPMVLYQQSVQQPGPDVKLYDRLFRERFGRRPMTLREDFCGTSLVACEWVRSKPGRRAFGVDLDANVLTWGARHNVLALSEAQRSRVQLIQGDVLTVPTPKADVLVAANFSFCVFQTRASVLSYFKAARKNLSREGVFVLDVLGGADTQVEDREETRRITRAFSYVWEQKRFDPVNYRAQFAIHFRFRDGSEIRNAFRYDWRLWTLPELRELILEAGFKNADVYWEGTDLQAGTGNGVFRRVTAAPADTCWIACLVGS